MSYEELLLERDGAVAILTLNRPDIQNAITRRMRRELHQVLREIKEDDSVRAVVLTGSGNAFCAGAFNPKEKGGYDSALQTSPLKEALELKDSFTPEMQHLDKAIIATVNGRAEGTGLALCLASDIRIAAKSAHFVDHFQARAMIPGGGSTFTLPRIVGAGKAMELLLTGESLEAEEAFRIGLVNQVVEDAFLLQAAKEMAGRIARGSPIAIAMLKRTVYAGLTTDVLTHWKLETHALNVCMHSEDHREGMRAYVEGRPPRFAGR